MHILGNRLRSCKAARFSDLSGSLGWVYTNEYAGEQNTWLLSKGERCWVPDLSGSLERVYASTYIPGNRQCGFNSEESIP